VQRYELFSILHILMYMDFRMNSHKVGHFAAQTRPVDRYTGVLNVRLTPAIHRQIAILARQAGQTLNAFIKEAVEEKVEAAVAL